MNSEQQVVRYRAEDFKKPAGNLTALKGMGLSVQSAVADALPSFLRKQAPAMLRALYTECQKNPQLLACTPESLFGACIQAAQMGLQLGGALGQCYLIPFKGRVTLVPGYKGYIQLVNRSGQAGVINAYVVYDKDEFRVIYGTSPGIHHIPADYPTAKDVRERKAIAYYATCQTRTGSRFVVLTRAEAEVHRDKFALSANGPWKEHFDQMALKTAIIKLCKYLPMSAELQIATSVEERLEAGEPVDTSFLFPGSIDGDDDNAPPLNKIDALRARLAPAQQPSPVLDLLAELSQEGGDAAVARFFEAHNVTEDDLAIVKGKKADEYVSLLRAAVEEAKGVPA
jgi:recombination protein RecT